MLWAFVLAAALEAVACFVGRRRRFASPLGWTDAVEDGGAAVADGDELSKAAQVVGGEAGDGVGVPDTFTTGEEFDFFVVLPGAPLDDVEVGVVDFRTRGDEGEDGDVSGPFLVSPAVTPLPWPETASAINGANPAFRTSCCP